MEFILIINIKIPKILAISIYALILMVSTDLEYWTSSVTFKFEFQSLKLFYKIRAYDQGQ